MTNEIKAVAEVKIKLTIGNQEIELTEEEVRKLSDTLLNVLKQFTKPIEPYWDR